MLTFKAIIQKYNSKGEKTGWTHVNIPLDVLNKLKRKDKKEFRVKGFMDDVAFSRLAAYPVGEGNFIIAINADLRKKLSKKEGAMVSVSLEIDASEPLQSKELMDCLNDDPMALSQFNSILPSHQNYFHRYVYSAKGADTKANRIASVINAMHKKINYGEMIRGLNKNNQ
jgi:hypothetical protein